MLMKINSLRRHALGAGLLTSPHLGLRAGAGLLTSPHLRPQVALGAGLLTSPHLRPQVALAQVS